MRGKPSLWTAQQWRIVWEGGGQTQSNSLPILDVTLCCVTHSFIVVACSHQPFLSVLNHLSFFPSVCHIVTILFSVPGTTFDKTMPIKLLRFPFLVQKLIFEEVDLLAVISITMLSKKSNAIARACLSHHRYHLKYMQDDYFQLERKFVNEDGNTLILDFHNGKYCHLRSPYQLCRIGKQEVAIESTRTDPDGTLTARTHVFSENYDDFTIETLRYLSTLLPKLSLGLTLRVLDAETFRRTMQSIESVEEIKEMNAVGPSWHRTPVYQDEVAKLVLDECRRAKKLRLAIHTSEDFVYPTTTMPFNFDSINVTSAHWVSRELFIKLFLSCKTVVLDNKDFNDADLTSIFKAWTEGSRLEYLELDGTLNFDQGKTLNSVFEEFPRAAPVKNAIVPAASIRDSWLVKFGEGRCYRIQQRDGQTTALVYIHNYAALLSTKFQIGKEVDEMAAQLEEDGVGRHIGGHFLDENMQAEED
ncbi:hypothetical protein CAEBREN_07605 [Caenorhabditis brenneri]|uniref:F-box domain-containing protein n=1 Tax=Caenorhabditis brenneri TaxID=135651 RepID=G0NCR5_CAEBE|nr:hypothetical protein CAEBREN_07605 [Caenorhabditis brenneri]